MRNRSALIIIAVIVIAFATVVVASTLSADQGSSTHSMPNGSSMGDGEMR